MILMSHMPKCGGTSFREGLEKTYGNDLYIYYNNPIKATLKRQIRRKIQHVIRLFRPLSVPPNCRIIYGHYCFDDFKTTFPDTKVQYGIFFRDPVEWVGSQLMYMKEKHPERISGDHLRDIERMELGTAFRTFLGSIEIEQLDFVGLISDYDNSLTLFQKVFGEEVFEFHQNKTKNAPKSYRKYFEQNGLLPDIENIMKENHEIYERAFKRYNALCLHHGLTTPLNKTPKTKTS